MKTTLINTKKRVPDKGFSLKTKHTGKSKLISLVLLFLISLSGMSVWSQVEPHADGSGFGWNQANINSWGVNGVHYTDPVGNGVTDTQFTTGSKDYFNAGCSTSNCLTWNPDGQTKGKNDIANAATIFVKTLTRTRLYFAGDRDKNTGDAQVGFWYYKNKTAPIAGGTFAPPHAEGDLFILANFTNGGANPEILIYQWVNSGGNVPNTNGHLNQVTDPNIAWAAHVNQSATAINRPTGWASGGNGETTYDTNEFYEGYVDFTNAPEINLCFTQFLLETRASQEVTASLDDFCGGNLHFTPAPPIGSASVCSGFKANITATGCEGGTIKWYLGADPNLYPDSFNTVPTYETPILTQNVTYYVTCTLGGCEGERGPITVTVKPNPAPTAKDLTLCEEGSSGQAHFDLTSAMDSPDGGVITFHLSQNAANDGSGAISDANKVNYLASNNTQIFVRSVKDGCFGTTSFKLYVTDRPDILVQDLTKCEEGTSTKAHFDLNTAVTQDDNGTLVGFYTSLDNAQKKQSAIQTAGNFEASNNTEIFVRYENSISESSKCETITSFHLFVKDTPDIVAGNLKACEEISEAGVPLGYAHFNLNSAFADQVNTTLDGTLVGFYTSSSNAQNDSGKIDAQTASNYQVAVPGTTIWVRSIQDGCPGIGSFNIVVNQEPTFKCPGDFSIGVPCGIQLDAAKKFAQDQFDNWLKGLSVTLGSVYKTEYDYTPDTPVVADGSIPLIPQLETSNETTSVKITWTFRKYASNNVDYCERSCFATFELTRACRPGCATPTGENLTCYQNNSGSVTAKAALGQGTPPFVFHLYKLSNPQDNASGVLQTPDSGNQYPDLNANPPVPASFKFTGLVKGTYYVVITDAVDTDVADGARCSNVILTEPTQVQATCSGTNVSCNGAKDATASVVPSGGTIASGSAYKYSWNTDPVQTTASISGLAPNIKYTVTVTDDNGCTASCDFTPIQPAAVAFDLAKTDVTCNSLANGKLSITNLSGGKSGDNPTFKLYKNGTLDPNFTSEAGIEAATFGPGDYKIEVCYPDGNNNGVDKLGVCCANHTVTISQPDDLVIVAIDDVTVPCGQKASISGSFDGGTPPYVVYLDNVKKAGIADGASKTFSFTDVAVGPHTITVYDKNGSFEGNNGCQDTEGFEVKEGPCGGPLCTYTQGAYGNAGGKYCDGDESGIITVDLIKQAISNAHGQIIVGILDKNSIKMTASDPDVACILAKMPGGGAAAVLPSIGNATICDAKIPLNKQGKIVNVLLSQTIALSLNINMKDPNDQKAGVLASLELKAGELAAADQDGGCGSNKAIERHCIYVNGILDHVDNDYTYRSFSQSVIDAIDRLDGIKDGMVNGHAITVGDLLQLANNALAGLSTNGASLSEIAGAVGSVNEVFDGCKVFIGWDVRCPQKEAQPAARMNDTTSDTSSSANMIIAYPNPFKDHLTFELSADVSANASLQVFNILGQKVSDVFNGYLEAGTRRTIDFNTPYNMNETMLIYVYKLGDHTYTGRLIIKP